MQIGRNLRVALALATIAEGVAAWRAPKDERRHVVASLAVVRSLLGVLTLLLEMGTTRQAS